MNSNDLNSHTMAHPSRPQDSAQQHRLSWGVSTSTSTPSATATARSTRGASTTSATIVSSSATTWGGGHRRRTTGLNPIQRQLLIHDAQPILGHITTIRREMYMVTQWVLVNKPTLIRLQAPRHTHKEPRVKDSSSSTVHAPSPVDVARNRQFFCKVISLFSTSRDNTIVLRQDSNHNIRATLAYPLSSTGHAPPILRGISLANNTILRSASTLMRRVTCILAV
jgi:hypothetical protein